MQTGHSQRSAALTFAHWHTFVCPHSLRHPTSPPAHCYIYLSIVSIAGRPSVSSLVVFAFVLSQWLSEREWESKCERVDTRACKSMHKELPKSSCSCSCFFFFIHFASVLFFCCSLSLLKVQSSVYRQFNINANSWLELQTQKKTKNRNKTLDALSNQSERIRMLMKIKEYYKFVMVLMQLPLRPRTTLQAFELSNQKNIYTIV